MKWKKMIRIPAFILVVLAVLLCAQQVFKIPDYSIHSRERGFKQEKKNTLDAVYIGASHVFSFYEPPLAWNDYGIAVFDYAIPSMTLAAVEYRIRETYRTQPDALYIINLNIFKPKKANQQILHRNIDYMPWSLNKLKMMRTLFRKAGVWGIKRAEYFMPIIRFHSAWSELKSDNYDHPVNGLKGAYTYGPYLQFMTDMTGQFPFTQERGELDSEQEEALEHILSYCDEKELRVLFVMVPQKLDEEFLAQVNTLEDIVTQRGYDCLDLRNRMDEMQIDPARDFHDENHLNVHGAIKFTDYLVRYLQETYGFEDKRQKPGWESWDSSVALYMDVIAPFCLDIERTHEKRDPALEAPEMTVQIVDGKDGKEAVVSWEKVPGADGYAVYCKTAAAEKGWWHRVGESSGDDLTWTGQDLVPGAVYTWTVVPFRQDDGETVYGLINQTGTEVTVPEGAGTPNAGEGGDD